MSENRIAQGSAGAKPERAYAHFRARFLPALAEFICSAGDMAGVPPCEAVFIEPAEKGVDLVATDGHALAWLHDHEGFASHPARLSARRALVAACQEPARPTLIDVNGDDAMVLPPAWMRPGRLSILQASDPESRLILVEPLEQPPAEQVGEPHSDGYGLYSRSQRNPMDCKVPPYRDVFEKAPASTAVPRTLTPELVARIGAFAKVTPRPMGWRMHVSSGEGPVIFESPTWDGTFIKVAIMPMRTFEGPEAAE